MLGLDSLGIPLHPLALHLPFVLSPPSFQSPRWWRSWPSGKAPHPGGRGSYPSLVTALTISACVATEAGEW